MIPEIIWNDQISVLELGFQSSYWSHEDRCVINLFCRHPTGAAAAHLRGEAAGGRPHAGRLQHPQGVHAAPGASPPRWRQGRLPYHDRTVGPHQPCPQTQWEEDGLPQVRCSPAWFWYSIICSLNICMWHVSMCACCVCECVVDLAHFSPMPCKYVMETGAMRQLLIAWLRNDLNWIV